MPTATSPQTWSVAKNAALGRTVCSRKSLYQPIGLPAANSVTRFGWNPMKRAETVGYGNTPQANPRASLVHTALRNPAPATTRSSASQASGASMCAGSVSTRHLVAKGGRDPGSMCSASSSSAPEQVEQPLPEEAEQWRRKQRGDAARERERPAEQRRLVREHADRAHQRLGGDQGDQRACRGAVLEEVRSDGKEEIWPARQGQTRGPPDQDALAHALAAKPPREGLRRDQDLDEPGEEEPEGQIDPNAAEEAAAGRNGPHGQVRIPRDRHRGRGDDQPKEDPGAGVQPPCHAGAGARAVRYSSALLAGASASTRAVSISA